MTIKELSRPDAFQWSFRAIVNWLEILVLFWIMSNFDSIFVHLPALFILGTRQHALALLGHEAIHRNISQNRFINNFLGSALASLPLFQTLNLFKKFHLDHHANIQTPKDPEIHFRSQTPHRWSLPLTQGKRLKLFLLDMSGIGYLESRHVLYMAFSKLGIKDFLIPAVFWSVVIFLFVKLDVGWIPLYWTIAFVTSYWAMFRQRALVEHLGTDGTHLLHANYLQRFLYLPHNTWFHFEHHLYPNVPCWNLPKVRAKGSKSKSVSVLYKELKAI